MSASGPSRRPEPRLPISPQLALRIAVIGGLAFVMFAVIFFRLWYLQVLTGEQYVAQAASNYVRSIPIAAPRGQILDREGKPLAVSYVTNEVQVNPAKLPPPGKRRDALYRRLGGVLEMSPSHIRELVEKGHREVPYANVTIKTDAGKGALTVLGERQNEFPGVTQQPATALRYPEGKLAAQVLGYVGQINEEELKNPGFKGVKPGSVVGQAGLEYYYDHYLRGVPGRQRVVVNALGESVPETLTPEQPTAGYNLRTSLSLGLQREGEKALDQTIEGGVGDGGAFVAMDPLNGEVLAMGSYPTFNPNEFDHPLTQHEYDALTEGSTAPLENRATEGNYPTGSTFKPITAMGALEAGVITTETEMGAGECVMVGDECRHNSGDANLGENDVTGAIKVSEDTFFYLVGVRANDGLSIQNMAHELGVGEPTGIDLPGEITGNVPDAKTVAALDKAQRKCEGEQSKLRRHHRPYKHCEIAAEGGEGIWTLGDNANLAVGQGELETSPLQMAVAYSTLANAYLHGGDGTVVTPHLGTAIEEPQGGVVKELSHPLRRHAHVHLNDADLQAVMTGLHEATSEEGGTSADVWSGWDQAEDPVYGKTGTAEREGQNEQAWYMCYVGNAKHPIVIAVTVEEGGYGDAAAAPIARLMASEFYGKTETYVHGSNTDQ